MGQRSTFSALQPQRLLALCAALLLAAACTGQSPDSLVSKGRAHLDKREYGAAQVAFRHAIQLAPNNSAAHRWLAQAFLHEGDAAAAETTLRRALQLGDSREQVVPLLAQALLRRGQPLRVIDEFGTELLAEAASRASLQASLGTAYAVRGNPDKAAAAFAAALSAVPEYAPARVGQATLAATQGRLGEALALLDALVARQPEANEAHVLRARLLLAQGHRAAAGSALEAALAADVGDLTARSALVALHIAEGKLERAQPLLDAKVGARAASDPGMGFLRALVSMHRGDLAKAKAEAEALLRKWPQHVPTLTLAGQIELRADRAASAEAVLQSALRLQPSSATIRRLLAAAHLRQGQANRALDALQPLLSEPGADPAGVQRLAGEAYLAGGDFARAQELFEQAQAAGDLSAQARLVQMALMRGDIASATSELSTMPAGDAPARHAELTLFAGQMRRRDHVGALAAAERLRAREPTSPLGPVLAGRVRLAQGDTAAARQQFEAALALQPHHTPALRGLAEADLIGARPADALRRLEAAAAARPDDEALWVALADVQARTDAGKQAVESLRKAVQANPRSGSAHAALVQLLSRQGERRGAIEAARLAAMQNPGNLPMLELLAATLEAAGERDEALRAWQELPRLQPRAPVPWLKLAAAQARFDDRRGAAQSLRHARESVPDHESVASDLVAVLLADGQAQEAMVIAKEMQARRPQAAVGHRLEGEVHASVYRWADAEAALRKALGLEPSSSRNATALCRMLRSAGRAAAAEACISDWLSRHAADVAMREHAAEVATAAADHRGAAAHYEVVATHAPHSVLALVRWAGALGRARDPRALGVAERALALAPHDADALGAVGGLLVDNGEAARGLPYLQKARLASFDRRDIRLHHAIALAKLGRNAEARGELRDLLATAGDFPGKADIPALLRRF